MDGLVGILGGMGPEATVSLFSEFIINRNVEHDQDHIPVIILSCPDIPDRTECILNGKTSPLPKLVEYLKILENSGVQCIIIGCNTAHYWFDELNKSSSVNLISMIDSAVLSVKKYNYKRIALLATEGTIFSRLYQNKLDDCGISFMIPDHKQQALISDAIAKIKSGLKPDIEELKEQVLIIMKGNGADCFLLGCTELPLVFYSLSNSFNFINPSKEVALAAINWFENIKKEIK